MQKKKPSIFLNKKTFSPKWTKMSDRLTYNNLYYYTYQDWNVNTCNFRESSKDFSKLAKTGFGEVLQAIYR
jgi:hypothetical protein